jgi:hypothetical protein
MDHSIAPAFIESPGSCGRCHHPTGGHHPDGCHWYDYGTHVACPCTLDMAAAQLTGRLELDAAS